MYELTRPRRGLCRGRFCGPGWIADERGEVGAKGRALRSSSRGFESHLGCANAGVPNGGGRGASPRCGKWKSRRKEASRGAARRPHSTRLDDRSRSGVFGGRALRGDSNYVGVSKLLPCSIRLGSRFCRVWWRTRKLSSVSKGGASRWSLSDDF